MGRIKCVYVVCAHAAANRCEVLFAAFMVLGLADATLI